MRSRDNACMLGIDIGSGGCKILLIDSDGMVLGNAYQEYNTNYLKPSWVEQNPTDWYDSFLVALRKVMLEANIHAKSLSSIGLTGMGSTSVFLDEKGNPVRPSIHWTDQRSVDQVEMLRKVLGKRVSEITCQPLSTSFTLSQLMWVKENQPDIWKKTYKILLPKDYVRLRLTGSWYTDWSDASHTLMFDLKKKKWSEEICKTAGISLDKLPELAPSFKVIGYVSRKASHETGLVEGTPVVAGALDATAESLGVGISDSGQSLIRLGTAAVILIVSEKPLSNLIGRSLTLCHALPDRFLIAMVTQTAGLSLRWFRDRFCKEEVEIAQALNRNPYEIMDEEASEVPVGSEGLLFHPYLMGERSPYWDPYLKASFFGVTTRHEKKHFIRAILEGVAFSIRDCSRVFQEVDILIKDARIIGGGARSDLWRQIISDMLGVRLLRPTVEDASFGAALIGGVGTRVFRSAEEAVLKCVRIATLTQPDSGNHKRYEELFRAYREIHDEITDSSKLLHEAVGTQ